MKRFKFSLKAVQNLRQHIEQECKDTHARERQRLNKLEDEGKRLRSKFKFWSAQFMKNAQAGMSPQEAVRINDYIEELNRLIDENDKLTAAQAIAVEKARLELIEKMKDRKTMDRLYEKQFSSYTENEQYKAEREIEEIITSRLHVN